MIGFIIMQIGDAALDDTYRVVIAPAVEACGLKARRVDKHNKGGLLKSEIIRFIEDATIIIADLTNERPNVYPEVGYTMGVGKVENLVLTAREDHLPDLPRREPDSPKVHFDLAGYDILYWDPEDLPAFRKELEKRLQHRLTAVQHTESPVHVWDPGWLSEQHRNAIAGLERLPHGGRLFVHAALRPPKVSVGPNELLDAARQAPVETLAAPIGLVVGGTQKGRPRPSDDGISASMELGGEDGRYDYWAIRSNGDFFCVKSLLEDRRDPKKLYFDTRIMRLAEILLYVVRLYTALEVDRSVGISVRVSHRGLKGRLLSASTDRELSESQFAHEDSMLTEISGTLEQLESDRLEYVKQLARPLLRAFDFFELSDPVYEDIVGRFVAGKAS